MTWLLTVSIPSSRVGTRLITYAIGSANQVSIPSSRVGTFAKFLRILQVFGFHPLKSGRDQLLGHLHPYAYFGFHPLKSGRDRACRRHQLSPQPVSIPSSRVGTDGREKEEREGRRFPSPQVGSGLGCAPKNLHNLVSFHPLKSGRDLLGELEKLCNDIVSIPSSRVGTTG